MRHSGARSPGRIRAHRAALRIAAAVGLSTGISCAHADAGSRAPMLLRLELDARGIVDVDAPSAVERSVRRRAAIRPELELTADSRAPSLTVRLASIRNARLEGDPRLRAPHYRVEVRLWAEVRDGRRELAQARSVGKATYVARAGGIERLDGAYRTFVVRAAEQAADRLIDTLAFRLRSFTSTRARL